MSEIRLGQRMNVLVSDIRVMLLPRPNQPRFLLPPKCQLPDFFGSYLIVIVKIVNSGNCLVSRLVLFPGNFYVIHKLE